MTSPAGVVDGLLADRYRLTARLGAGGMGEVWRAEDVLLERVVAVKTLLEGRAADDEHRARFRAEARSAARLSHPGIATVYDFGELPDRAWLVMELVDGEPLSTVLRRQGRLDAARTLDLVGQVAAALDAAHTAGVVHRDVKPGNLLVRPDGVVKVTDFGIASTAGAVPLTQTGQVVGTAGYLSPEQAAGGRGSPSTDLYALGVVAYECLSGARPFAAESPVAELLAHLQAPPPPLPDSVPAPVRDLVLRLLAKDPADRPADAGALVGEVRAARRAVLVTEVGEHAVGDGPAVAVAAAPATSTMVLDDPYPHEPSRAGAPLREVRPAPGAGAPDRPGRDHSGTAARATSRRTQRWAVRLTALLLALLAVGLGLRGTAGEGSTSVPPASPTTPADEPASGGAGEVSPDSPTGQVPPPAPAAEVGGTADSPVEGTADSPVEGTVDGPADGTTPDDGAPAGNAGGDGGSEDDDKAEAEAEDKDRAEDDDKGKSEDKGKSDDGKGGGP